MIYYIILGFCIFIAALSHLIKNRTISAFLTMVIFIILWIVSSLRFEIGTDFVNYVKQYNDIKGLSLFGTNLEPLYVLIVKLVYYTTDNPQYLFSIISLITLISFFSFYDRKYSLIAIFVFITVMYLPSFSLIRQSAAVSILLLSSKALVEKRTSKSVMLTLLAAMFHFSALLFIPFILLRNFRIKFRQGIILLILCAFSIIIYNLPLLILQSGLLAGTKYGVYAGNMFSAKTEVGTGLGVILKILPSIIFIISSEIFKWRRNEELLPVLKVILWFNYAFIVAVMLSLSIQIFNRLVDFMMFAPIVTAVYLPKFIQKPQNRLIIVGLFALVCFVNFSLMIAKNDVANQGGLGISPYKSIL